MQIYLAKPGGQKEGPFTLDQINRELAAKKLSANDYWAWYEGLPSWMPLHSLPGVTGKAAAVVAPAPAPESVQSSAPPKAVQAPAPKVAAPAAAGAVAAEPPQKPAAPPKPAVVEAAAPAPAPAPVAPVAVEPPKQSAELPKPAVVAAAKTEPTAAETAAALSGAEIPLKTVPSGLPFSALDQIFIFTTGEGRSVFESQLANQKLEDTIGEPVDKIRDQVQVNVVGRVDAGVEMMHDGSIPDKAWRAIAAIKPDVAEQAKAGAYQFCVRTLLAETNDVITLLLFYRKQG
jgi:hypothetical protein